MATVRYLPIAAVAALVTLTSCGSEAPSGQSGDGSGTAETRGAASPSTSRASVDHCPNRMENSPAESDRAAGTYAAHITDFPTPQSPLTFDVVQWLSGERAREAFEQETGDPNGPPNDYYLGNKSPETRSAPVAADARVLITYFAQGEGLTPKSAEVDELPAYVNSAGPETVYWLTFGSGEITEVCEQWRP